MIGTSRRHMIRLEKGVHRPGPEFVARIAEHTGEPEEFFASDDEETVSLRSVTIDELLRYRVDQIIAEALRA